MYGLPESPDTFTDVLCPITHSDNWPVIRKLRLNLIKNAGKERKEEDLVEETKVIMREKHEVKSVVGLFSKWDGLGLERMVGSANYKRMIKNEAKDSFNIN